MHLLNFIILVKYICISAWNAPFELMKYTFWIMHQSWNARFELYNVNNLNENKIVTTFESVDKLYGELNVKYDELNIWEYKLYATLCKLLQGEWNGNWQEFIGKCYDS